MQIMPGQQHRGDDLPHRVHACPVRPDRLGSTQSTMSIPRSTGPDVVRLADPHQTARAVHGQHPRHIITHRQPALRLADQLFWQVRKSLFQVKEDWQAYDNA